MTHDPLHTEICDLLQIDYPVISAGMGFVARAELAAAVSNAGGLGVVGGAGFTPERLRLEIQRTRELTDKPFGVDLLLPVQTTGEVLLPRPENERPKSDPQVLLEDSGGEWALGRDGRPVRPEDLMQIVLEEVPPVFAAGLGNPGPWVPHLHDRGVVVMGLVGTARAAKKVADSGADIIVAQGTEAGGHTGRIATAALTPTVIETVKPKPVVTAGGITSGAGLAGAIAMGAKGVWMGTRFVATHEAHAHINYKTKILEATEDSTVVTRSYSGKTLRVIRNKWTDEWEHRQDEILPFPKQFRFSGDVYVVARRDGDTDRGSMPCGQGAGLIHELLPAAEVVRRVVEEARDCLAAMTSG